MCHPAGQNGTPIQDLDLSTQPRRGNRTRAPIKKKTSPRLKASRKVLMMRHSNQKSPRHGLRHEPDDKTPSSLRIFRLSSTRLMRRALDWDTRPCGHSTRVAPRPPHTTSTTLDLAATHLPTQDSAAVPVLANTLVDTPQTYTCTARYMTMLGGHSHLEVSACVTSNCKRRTHMATATATAPAFGWISYFLRGMGKRVFALFDRMLAIAWQLRSMVKRLRTCLFRRGGVMSRHCLWLPDMCKAAVN
jgi:hypothetical protein